MKLTENFTYEEMIFSQTATLRGIRNIPCKEEHANLKVLCEGFLQKLRDRLGCAIVINSGFRSHFLNQAVGGSKFSQHMNGEAADFYVPSMALEAVWKIIVSEFEFDQVIFEFGQWIHVSFKNSGNRNKVTVAKKVDGKTVYKDYTQELGLWG